MPFAYTVPASAIRWIAPAPASDLPAAQARAEADRRWPMIVRKLAALRRRHRCSVRIVDAECGAGELLVAAARQARALGFVAIEGRGVDADARLVARARALAAAANDPAIGLVFEVGDARPALREEAAFPADLLLYRGAPRHEDARLMRAAGRVVLGNGGAGVRRRAA